jgi:hypothetical protein
LEHDTARDRARGNRGGGEDESQQERGGNRPHTLKKIIASGLAPDGEPVIIRAGNGGAMSDKTVEIFGKDT